MIICFVISGHFKLNIIGIIIGIMWYYFVIDPRCTCFEVSPPIVLASLIIYVSLLFVVMTSERLTVLTDPSAALKVIYLPSKSVIVL
ncbi:MAG: hypothetical protein Ta2E_01370 [Mycoplasmoidaceae bacterium]|nr:MAG: hypothetical protein Ta2E_01370 [Mycoplasmoidaceae bacterium]